MNKIRKALDNINHRINYKKIKSGNSLNMSKKPFDIKQIDEMISFFEDEEEYEKCEILLKFKSKILDHENNYYKSII